ncbi:conserved protein of unknown function [Kyrpidia spormannii]|uniref:Uncharacterized protein n=2 Tax=Kyrpidia spormannii TaxID=2055160 RepID=A0ACA8ZBD5_9BACL|nr:conserved protein of unknown function [Kyrpidia spormannii]CAB3394785.1 conserved protein of unknown function [Kyrpidia spormannii]
MAKAPPGQGLLIGGVFVSLRLPTTPWRLRSRSSTVYEARRIATRYGKVKGVQNVGYLPRIRH